MSALLSASQLESGSQGRFPLHEGPVFIISRESLLPALSASILDNAQPHSLPAGCKSQRAFSFKVNPHLSALSLSLTVPSFSYPRG